MATAALVPPGARIARSRADVRSYTEDDREQVKQLLSVLPELYPDGARWLDRRLNEVNDLGPRCSLLAKGTKLIGVAIETPKSGPSMKLSTFFIAGEYRGHGFGTQLAEVLVNKWLLCDIESAYVTVAHTQADALLNCLEPAGFRYTDTERDRYGAGRHEVILKWSRSWLTNPLFLCPSDPTMPIEFSKV